MLLERYRRAGAAHPRSCFRWAALQDMHVDPASAHALTVPLPAERRAVDRSHHHLARRMRVLVSRRGRTVFAAESALAGLERGGAT